MAVSEKKRLEVANVCYANVSGMFATFCNDRYRGPNFRWDEFPDMMVDHSEDWIFMNNIRGNKTEIQDLAREFAREIAEHLVKESGFGEIKDKK